MTSPKRRSDCPINYALDLFGDKWTFLIVRDMVFKGKKYYGDFLKSDEKIATNILADRLAGLESSGIAVKLKDPAHGSKFIYQLTQKGLDLLPILVEIIIWSASHDKQTIVDASFIHRVKTDKVNLLKEIYAQMEKELAL